MSETPPETPTPAQDDPPKNDSPADPPKDDTDWKAESRKWEQRAKENGTKAKEFDQQRKAAMTDAERAVTEAEERGRTAAVSDFGRRLARTEFDALAGRRNPDIDTASVLEYVDLARFVGDDGEPDTKAITAAVERLVPAAGNPPPPGMDLGARQTAPTGQDMSSILRRAAGRT